MAEIIWTEPAIEQLYAIAEYIALDKPEAAAEVVRAIFETTDDVGRFLKLGRKVPEISDASYRQLWVRPCMIYYRISEDRVYILHVRRGEQAFTPSHLI